MCIRCGKRLPLSRFSKSSFMPDGHLDKCIACTQRDSNPFSVLAGTRKRQERTKDGRRDDVPDDPVMPPKRAAIEPDGGKEKRTKWIEEHKQHKKRNA